MRFHDADADAGKSYGDMGSGFHATRISLIFLEQEASALLQLLYILSNLKIKNISFTINYLRTVSACRDSKIGAKPGFHFSLLFCVLNRVSFLLFFPSTFLVWQSLPQDTAASLDQHAQSTLHRGQLLSLIRVSLPHGVGLTKNLLP